MNKAKTDKDDVTLTPDEEAFLAYRDAWRQELEQNWSGGYAQMPNEVRHDPTISAKAKILYEQLLSYMWFKSDRCWPSQATLAEATGYSRRTVIRALNELYERGYIEKWRRGLGNTNYYFINPLSFVRSFRPLPGPRTSTSLPHNNIVPVQASALRQGIDTATPRPIEPLHPEVTNWHNGSDSVAHAEVTDWHTKHTNLNENSLGKNNRYTRSGFAAEPLGEKGVAVAAIGNEYTPETKGTNGSTQRPLTKSNTKTSLDSETRCAARAEDVEMPESKRKKHEKGEIPPPLPRYLSGAILEPLSLRFCDQSRESSKTSFAWIYAEMHTRGQDEYSEAFLDLVNEARDTTIAMTSKGRIRGRNKDGSIAQMPYFLTILERNVDAWCKRYDGTIQQPISQGRQSEEEGQRLPTSSTDQDQEEYIATDDPAHGWTKEEVVQHANRLYSYVGRDFYQCLVLPTRCPGRYGFIVIERHTGKEWVFVTAEAIDDCMHPQD